MTVKLAVVVRTDLGMGRGKIAAQVAHAAVAATLASLGTAGQLEDVVRQGRESGLPVEVISDAGRTQVTPGTLTGCALGPAESHRIDAVTAGLSLL
jgi:peptidyl-tRNA hydrolase, PTH2 family